MVEERSAVRSAAAFTRRLGWFGFALGVCLIIIGLIVLIRPGASLTLLAILVGIQLLFLGVVRVVSAVTSKGAANSWRTIVIIAGVLTAAVGVVCLIRPGGSLTVLAIVIAIGWMIDGLATLVSVFMAPPQPQGRSRVSQSIFGICMLIAGIIVLVWPEKSLVVMTQLVGVILIVLGVLAVGTALPQLRAKDQPATGAPSQR